MKQDKHDHALHTLTGAYALDALQPAEHEAFTAHLADCTPCRQEVDGFAATAARLAGAAALPPPPRMKDAVLFDIDSVRQLPPLLAESDAPAGGGPALAAVLRRRARVMVLAASVAAAALLAGVAVRQEQGADRARDQAQAGERRLQDLAAVMAAPDARTVRGRTAGGAATSVVSSRQQDKAVFVGAGLPDPGEGRTYQLWFDDHGTMRPAGLLAHDGATVLDGGIRGANGVGLTLEPAGGSPQPTSRPLLLLALPA
ncbi:anti-sigma factor [Streptomyces sp. NPDC032472]|uniref:anti-sigma factor n=1 Tax=Streptomyces sp. NPDC032472 TaxID=3155018 RepID=UPI0033DDC357